MFYNFEPWTWLVRPLRAEFAIFLFSCPFKISLHEHHHVLMAATPLQCHKICQKKVRSYNRLLYFSEKIIWLFVYKDAKILMAPFCKITKVRFRTQMTISDDKISKKKRCDAKFELTNHNTGMCNVIHDTVLWMVNSNYASQQFRTLIGPTIVLAKFRDGRS